LAALAPGLRDPENVREFELKEQRGCKGAFEEMFDDNVDRCEARRWYRLRYAVVVLPKPWRPEDELMIGRVRC